MQWAERCFNSLRKSTVKPDVFVVDNGSTDGTQAYIQVNYSEILFIQSENNLGFGRANNLGIEYAINNGYDYVYLLNQDAWVEKDMLEKLISVSKENPKYGILSPTQMQADMKSLDKNFAYNIHVKPEVFKSFNDYFKEDKTGVVELDYIMAAHWLITRECIMKVGAFSPSFPHYGEDNNYCHRVLYHGLKIGVVPSAKAVHDRQYRIEPKSKKMYIGYISSIIGLSNINRPVKAPVFDIVRNQFALMIKNKSFEPIKYTIRLLRELKTILANRRVSMKEGAFLSR